MTVPSASDIRGMMDRGAMLRKAETRIDIGMSNIGVDEGEAEKHYKRARTILKALIASSGYQLGNGMLERNPSSDFYDDKIALRASKLLENVDAAIRSLELFSTRRQ